MIFFFKSDGTLIKSAPETVYQGSAEAGKVYVVAPLNANMLVDVYYELPNGERWGAYLLENNGTVINNEELPDGWALWSTTLESAITQYAGTLKAQFGFYQSGTADKVPLITSQGVTITIAKGVVRDVFPDSPSPQVYEYITNAVSTILQNFKNLPNEYLENTQEDKIALKNNKAIEYSENATAGTIAKRDRDGKINVADGTEDLNAVNVRKLNAELETKVTRVPIESGYYNLYGESHDGQIAVPFSQTTGLGTIPQRTITGQLKAADGVADDDLATVKQLNAVQGNYTDITNIDLNTGDTTVEYDTELGITVNAKGTVTHENGATEQPTTKFELPIIAGDGIVIDKAQNEEKISVKVDGEVTKTPNSIVKRDSAGRVKTADAVSDEDATSYGQHKALLTYTDSELLKKLDRTGGTITGNLIVSGNLSVSGEASVIESTTLKVADKLIYVAKDNTSALTSPAGLITPKYDGTNDGGIVYDNSGTAYVGDIKLDSSGNVDVNNSDLQPIATRDNYSNFTTGHKVKVEVDSLQKSVKFVDGGKDDGINTLTDVNLTLGDTTVQYDTTDGIQINSTARFTTQGTNHDAMMDIALPVVGKDGIVIDKAADAEKIEISGKNFPHAPYLESVGGRQVVIYNENNKTYGYRMLDDSSLSQGAIPFYRDSAQANAAYLNNSLYTGDPKSNYAAANKKYVDEGFVAKVTTPTQDARVYGLYANGTQTVFATSQNVPATDHIAQYTTAGNIRTNTPINDLDCANKKYVDDNIAAHSEYFVKAFTIPNGTSTGTLAADVKEKLCNPDGHNYYVFDDTSQMILKYSFNADDEIIQYTAIYIQNDKAYEITMQILPSSGSWRRSQTVLNGGGGKLYLHSLYFASVTNKPLLTFYSTSQTKVTDEWIYNNLTDGKYCLTFYPTITSIYQYGGVGLSSTLSQTSSSPSWGALISLESNGPTTLSVSQATYTVTEV